MNTTQLYIAALAMAISACTSTVSDNAQLNDDYKKGSIEAVVLHPDSFASLAPFAIDTSKVAEHRPAAPKVTPYTPRAIAFGEVSHVVAATKKEHVMGEDDIPAPVQREARGRIVASAPPLLYKQKEMRRADINPEYFGFYNLNDAVGMNNPLCLTEDSRGNLWWGSSGSGASRYDGINYAIFNHGTGLSFDIVTSFYEDREGNIWMGTNGGGACKYDGINFTIYGEAEGLHNQITNITETADGTLWIGTFGGGLFRYEPDGSEGGGSFFNYTTEHGICGTETQRISPDQKGNLWFYTRCNMVHKYEPAQDGRAERIIQFGPSQNSSKGDLSNLEIDNKDVVWVCGRGNVLFSFDGSQFSHYALPQQLEQGSVTAIDYHAELNRMWLSIYGGGIGWFNPNDPSELSLYNQADGMPSLTCGSIYATSDGTTYTVTDKDITILNPNAFENYTEARGLAPGMVRSVSEDKSGNYWISVRNVGLIKFDGKTFAKHDEAMGFHPQTHAVVCDANNNIWMASDGGLLKYSGGNNNKGVSLHQYNDSTGLSSKYLISLMQDSKGRIWAGSNGGGISILEPSAGGGKGGTLTHIRVDEGLSSNQVYCMVEASNGNYWIGTHNGGMSRYIPSREGKGTWLHYGEKQGLSSNSVISIIEDHLGHIWVGNAAGSLQLLIPTADGKNEALISFPDKLKPFSAGTFGMTRDHNDAIWIVGGSGVLKLSPSKYQLMLEKIEKGEVYDDDTFFEPFTAQNGYRVGGGRNSMITDSKGSIWMGSASHLQRLWPEAEPPPMRAPQVAVTSVSLANETIDWNTIKDQKKTNITLRNGAKLHNFSFDGLAPHYGLPNNLSLAHDNNNLSISFAGNTPKHSNLLRYKYKLEGLDKYWSPLNEVMHVPYANLPHGSYTFRVKALDSSGTWSEEAQYHFAIKPPWWLSSWAYACYFLLLAIIFWLLHTALKKRTLRIEREKTYARELAQAKEIEKAYSQLSEAHQNLKSTQAQLIHAEKMASLGELTAGIAHEIQNPLNFVNNFSEVSVELIDEVIADVAAVKTRFIASLKHTSSPGEAASPGETASPGEAASPGYHASHDDENILSDTEATLDDIKQNLEKITHHGKRADAIVKGMLAHSRSGKGEKAPTNINALAEEYLKLSYHGIRAKDKTFNADFKTEFDPNLPKVNVVPQDIGRVLLNLINNAFQAAAGQTGHAAETGHAPSLQALITVSTRNLGDKIEISVKDNGSGIPDAIKDKIFQPFFTTKPTGQGTGLGLSLSYDIVKAHGGELTVTSRHGEDTKFIIQLPT